MQHNINNATYSWQNPKTTAAVHYFHCNSHHHFHYHHFHYHCKMHLYPLKILLDIFFVVINPLSVSAKFCLLFTGIHFSLDLFQAFRFLCPVKGLRISLRLSNTLQMFSLYFIFASIVIYTSLLTLTCLYLCTLPYLHLLAYTYVHLLIHPYVLFII